MTQCNVGKKTKNVWDCYTSLFPSLAVPFISLLARQELGAEDLDSFVHLPLGASWRVEIQSDGGSKQKIRWRTVDVSSFRLFLIYMVRKLGMCETSFHPESQPKGSGVFFAPQATGSQYFAFEDGQRG